VNSGRDTAEEWSWEHAFSIHRPRLFGFAVFLVGPTAADDLLSETMLGCQNATAWPLIGDPVPYLFRALTNQSRKDWRSAQRRLQREVRYEKNRQPASEEGSSAIDPALAQVLLKLSPQQRSVVFQAYWLDLDIATIAARLDVSEGTVRKQLARARTSLRASLREVPTNAR
jgi:RNA polymerase sigma factor (sigma-70 family)